MSENEKPKWCQCNQPTRKVSQWALLRGCRVYNYALLDELHHGINAGDWEQRIAVAIEDALHEGIRIGRQSLEEKLGA